MALSTSNTAAQPDQVAEHARAELHRHGFVMIPDFISAEEVAAARENLQRYYPTAEAFYAAAPPLYQWLTQGLTAGIVRFPFLDDAVNDLLTGPKVVKLARDLIGVPDVRMVDGSSWAKYAGNFDYEQDFHRDYLNNTLVVPREDDSYCNLQLFIYVSDVTEGDGPTHLLSHEFIRALPRHEWLLPRDRHPELYEHELAAVGAPGTLVVYRLDTFHRGSALTSPTGHRWLIAASYCAAAAAGWIGRAIWPFHGGSPEMNRFLTRATVEQRSVIGFPAPGDPYWNRATLDGVRDRYPGIDMTPYEDARGAPDA